MSSESYFSFFIFGHFNVFGQHGDEATFSLSESFTTNSFWKIKHYQIHMTGVTNASASSVH